MQGKPGSGQNSIAVRGGTDDIHYGDIIRFDCEVEKLKGNEYPVIALQAYQDVDEDGVVETGMFGDDIVYAAPLTKPDDPIMLGGPLTTSLWADRGGDATVTAQLCAYSWKAGQESIRQLATLEPFICHNP
jgi:hypothetical protein